MTAQNIEAEQQLLGAILLNNAIYHSVASMVRPEWFFDPVHQRIFEAITAKITDGALASPVTLKMALENDEGLKALGGPAYLVRMAGTATSITQAARDYAEIVADAAALRALDELMKSATAQIASGSGSRDVSLALLSGLQALPEISGRESRHSFVKAATEAVSSALSAYQGHGSYLATGLEPLDRIIRGLGPGNYCLVGGAPSMGKAQPLTSMVLTETGWLQMGAIRVGERLASVDGAPSIVIGVFPQGRKQIYRMTFNDGRSVRCCGDHLWEVGGSAFKGQTRIISTADLAGRLKFTHSHGRIHVPLFGGEFGARHDLPLDPWLLGAFIGNGYSPPKGSPMFSTADAGTLARVSSSLHEDDEVSHAGKYDYRITGRRKRGSQLSRALSVLGLVGCRAETKFIPEAYLYADRTTRLALLQGLMDTDGWVERFGSVRYSTSSGTLAEQVASLVRSLGGVCSVSRRMPKFSYLGEVKIGQPHFVLNVRQNDPAELFSVHHKRQRCGRVRPVRLTVKSIEPDGVDEAQCIAVSHPRKLYVTDGYVMTHNTALAVEIAANVGTIEGQGVVFVSLEMTKEELANRVISRASRIPYNDIRAAEGMEEAVFRKWIETAKGEGDRLNMEIVPRHVRTAAGIRSAVKRASQLLPGGKPALVIVDYAQLIEPEPGRRYSGRTEFMTEVSVRLKDMASIDGYPLIAIVQLNREIGKRPDRRPQLTDIRETGQFEQDADQVVMVHRESYWLERNGPEPDRNGKLTEESRAEWAGQMQRWKNRMEIYVRKNRHGRIGGCEVGIHEPTNRFWRLGDDQEEFQ